jgi:hypothetical protein
MRYFCCDRRRRDAVVASSLNGIDYLEVLDSNAPTPADRQLILRVYLLKNPAGITLTPDNVRIEGGDRIRKIQVTQVETFPAAPPGSPDANAVQVRVNQWGDYSIYTLRFVTGQDNQLPTWIDPVLSAINFSFKVECPSEFDCRTDRSCAPEPQTPPEINYLAKDYASFRQLMLDRLATTLPQWTERNPADIGIALVELLAYVGDYLSYQQDAIATEAYLGTARRRVSVRRHVRLVDYFMHDGCNARVWVQVQVADQVSLPKGTQLLTRIAQQPVQIPPNSSAYDRAMQQQPEVFETMAAATLFQAHNRLPFYTWGNQSCCLPQGSTRASLRGHYPNLQMGDVLIFEEAIGPQTGEPEDANPAHRWAVRLTQIQSTTDPIGGQFADPPSNTAVDVTEIAWASEDALPFALCLSARTDQTHNEQYLDQVSVALGNIVLADHGRLIQNEPLQDGKQEQVPQPTLFRVPVAAADRCTPLQPNPIPPRFRPALKNRPLTHAAPYSAQASASAAGRWQLQQTLPAIALHSTLGQTTTAWHPQKDLLNSDRSAREFVVEMDTDGTSYIRFGDDQYGSRPAEGTRFTATYRIGNGVRGNVGADVLVHVVSNEGAITQARNPLPARGGVESETLEEVRQSAPYAFRIQERAVTAEDYARVAERYPGVQKAVATFRWTGSWRTVFVTIDRQGGLPVDPQFAANVRQHLERYRLAGYDLEVDAPRFVSLEIEMRVCVLPDYFRNEVKAALLQIFSSRVLPNGRQGLFHPDRFTFGQSVYLSPIYAAAQAVAGVKSVQITLFQRQGIPNTTAIDQGKLTLERLEIARLENDPDFSERGVLRLQMEGGK